MCAEGPWGGAVRKGSLGPLNLGLGEERKEMEGLFFLRFGALAILGSTLIFTWRRGNFEVRHRWTSLRPALPWLGGWILLSLVETLFSAAVAAEGGPSYWDVRWPLHQGAGVLLIGALWGFLRGLKEGRPTSGPAEVKEGL